MQRQIENTDLDWRTHRPVVSPFPAIRLKVTIDIDTLRPVIVIDPEQLRAIDALSSLSIWLLIFEETERSPYLFDVQYPAADTLVSWHEGLCRWLTNESPIFHVKSFFLTLLEECITFAIFLCS